MDRGWLDLRNDTMRLDCNVKIEVLGNDGVVQTIEKHNLVVTAGKNLIRDLLDNAAGVTGLNYFAVGIVSDAPDLGDTTLAFEKFRNTITTTTTADNKLTIIYFLTALEANGETLVEAGIFGDDATSTPDSGTLFARVTHEVINKTAAKAVTYTWDINIL